MLKHDLEMIEENVWIEIPVSDNFSLLIGDHYFPTDCNVTITDNYFKIFRTNLNAPQCRVIMLGNFNVPMTGLMVCHFHILTTTIKLKEIQFTRTPAFLILINAITLS
jgi:hypothetical protein